MSIDNCASCDKRLDTDFIEYQDDGTLLCGSCLDELENEQEPDWRALIPQDHADLTAQDSGLRGIRTGGGIDDN
jgi:hypothetical protein